MTGHWFEGLRFAFQGAQTQHCIDPFVSVMHHAKIGKPKQHRGSLAVGEPRWLQVVGVYCYQVNGWASGQLHHCLLKSAYCQ